MSQWDFYLCQIDGAPASVTVDLEATPADGRPWLLTLRWPLAKTTDNGLPVAEEVARLNRLDEELDSELHSLLGAVAVGRICADGHRECFFYTADEPAAAELGRGTKGLKGVEIDVQQDPDWRVFHDFLYPEPQALQWMQDRRVVGALTKHGDDLHKPRPVDHYVRFADGESCGAFADQMVPSGFTLRWVEGAEAQEEAGIKVQCMRPDAVALEHIHEVVWRLVQVAERFGGHYEGWGAPIRKRDKSGEKG